MNVRAELIARVGMAALMLTLGLRPALADGGAVTKAPEVSTIGSGPYFGPLPEELAKLAEWSATVEASPATSKQPEVATMSADRGSTLTPVELAKLAALPEVPGALSPVEMMKLEPMEVPSDGLPALTQAEQEKRAAELAKPAAPPTRSSR